MNRINLILQDKSFLKKTIIITIPIALQNLLNNVLNMVDTIMIGQMGETEISAVGLANKFFFVFSLLMFGICSGSGVLASQYWGKREIFNIKRVLHLSLIIGLSGSIFFAISGIFIPKLVMQIFTDKEEIIRIGAKYLWIVAISYPLTAVSMIYVAVLRSMNYVMFPVYITSASILVNVFFNYCLIFGKLGFPELGVTGAAIATLIARLVEVTVLLFLIHRNKAGDNGLGDFIHKKYDKLKENRTAFIHRSFVIKYLSTAAPVIANEFMWGLGVTLYSVVYGRMGEKATAAVTIVNNVEQVAMVFFFGICSAAAVILGNELGADEHDKAEQHAKNYIVIQFILTLLGGMITLLLKEKVIGLFNISPEVARYIRLCIIIFVIYMPVRMLNALFVVSILRSGGDTKAALFIDVSGVWLIGIPMAVLGGLILHLPVYYVYAMVTAEEVYKLILGFIRYRQKKWLKSIIAG